MIADTGHRRCEEGRAQKKENHQYHATPSLPLRPHRPLSGGCTLTHVACHIVPRIAPCIGRSSTGPPSTHSTRSSQEGRKRNGKSCLPVLSMRHAHAGLQRTLRVAVKWSRLMRHPVAAAEPPRVAGSAREAKTWGAEELASFAIPALQEE